MSCPSEAKDESLVSNTKKRARLVGAPRLDTPGSTLWKFLARRDEDIDSDRFGAGSGLGAGAASLMAQLKIVGQSGDLQAVKAAAKQAMAKGAEKFLSWLNQ